MKNFLKRISLFFIKILNALIPKKNLIVFYSSPDLADNAFAYFQYISENHPEWDTAWIVENVEYSKKVLEKDGLINVKIAKLGCVMAIYYNLIAKVQIDTHGAGYKKFSFNRYPLVISLWHGSPIKKIGRDIGGKVTCKQDILTSGARYFEPFFKSSIVCKNGQIVTTGYPRNDWITGALKTKFDVTSIAKPYIVWMPTYVMSKGSVLGGGGLFNDGLLREGYISFLSSSDLGVLDKELAKLGIDIYIKLHPYDILNTYDFSDKDLSNIKIICADDISMCGSRMYGMLRYSKGLITDYSSVIFDYILTNNPIGLDIPACETYTREKYFDYDLNQMNVHIIKNRDDLLSFCQNAVDFNNKKNQAVKFESKYTDDSLMSFSEAVYSIQKRYANGSN